VTTDPHGLNRCRSCDAHIAWVRTPAGKLMPLDAQPNPAGNVEVRDGVAIVHHQPPLTAEDLFMSHHATCPHADEWRRRGS